MNQNNYLRGLNHLPLEGYPNYPFPVVEEDIMILPDGYRWRIERTTTVGDLLQVGDVIKTSYGTGGLVIKLHKYTSCTCPHRAVSSTIFCEEAWDPPKQTTKYHIEIAEWSLIYVPLTAIPNKDGTYRETTHHYINEMVAVGNRILHLFEANKDEVIVTGKHQQMPARQMNLWDKS